LVLCSARLGAFDVEEINRLKLFANLTEMALQNLRIFEMVQQGRQRAQSLSKRLVEVQEEERRAVARELHDEIGQILTGLKIQLDVALRSGHTGAGMQELGEAQALTNELIGRVRQLSLDLRPAMLDDLGLLPALNWFFERYSRRTNIEVNFRHQGLEQRRFSSELETAAYRVAQEALTNVARYAKVQQVEVIVWATERLLQLQISDEGSGFSVEEKSAGLSSRGLAGMHERVGLVGGALKILSAPGEGTQVIVELPVDGILERRTNDRNHTSGG
jgi:signal transduction histidine kinase